jgi:O-antigen ligase
VVKKIRNAARISFVKDNVALLVCLVLLFIPIVISSAAGHDWQRLMQVALAVVACSFCFMRVLKRDAFLLYVMPNKLCVSIFVLGMFSSLLSQHLSWAFAELSVLIVSCVISLALCRCRFAGGPKLDKLFSTFVLILCLVKSFQFFVSLVAAFLSASAVIDVDLLLEGFSNKRHYGQFQTFTLPLLALPLLLDSSRRSLKLCVFSLLACWWMIAIAGGTRGTWLGMGCAASVICFCGPYARRWVCWQLTAIVAGLTLFWCLFSLLPSYLGIEVANFAGDRLTTSLSARDVIWHQALQMILERPLLGFGPMHFANIFNSVAAHPHQAILQWASEWGVPSTLLVGGLAAHGLIATLILIRKKAASSEPIDLLRICLFASLLAALAQSMVDGVIVMPYSQLWMAIVVGWLMGIHVWSVSPESSGPFLRWGWLATMVLALGFLVYIVARDFPHLDEREQRFAHDFGGRFQPRFWQQGVIATKPD